MGGLSRIDGQEHEGDKQDEVHPALQASRPPRDHGQDTRHDRKRKQHHLGGPNPGSRGPPSQTDATAITGMVSPMLAMADP
jgi:hypothetical protein